MSHVRVRLELHGVRLEYSGERSFFDRLVDPFVVAAAAKGSTNGVAARAGDERRRCPAGAPRSAARATAVRRTAASVRPRRTSATSSGSSAPRPRAPDRQVVAFAFYLWNYEKKEEFHEDEIAGCFRALGLSAAGERVGALRRPRRAASASSTPRAGGRKWRLTQKGANYVKTRLLGAV